MRLNSITDPFMNPPNALKLHENEIYKECTHSERTEYRIQTMELQESLICSSRFSTEQITLMMDKMTMTVAIVVIF